MAWYGMALALALALALAWPLALALQSNQIKIARVAQRVTTHFDEPHAYPCAATRQLLPVHIHFCSILADQPVESHAVIF